MHLRYRNFNDYERSSILAAASSNGYSGMNFVLLETVVETVVMVHIMAVVYGIGGLRLDVLRKVVRLPWSAYLSVSFFRYECIGLLGHPKKY